MKEYALLALLVPVTWYTLSFAAYCWRKGNPKASIAVVFLSALSIALSVVLTVKN